MNFFNRLKNGVAVVLATILTIVMFPVFLVGTTFLLMTGFAIAAISAYRLRQLIKQRASESKVNTHGKRGATIEGNFYVVHPVN